MGTRNPHIAAAVSAAILFPGGLLATRFGPAAVQAVVVVAFIVAFAVLHRLDEPEFRKLREAEQGSVSRGGAAGDDVDEVL